MAELASILVSIQPTKADRTVIVAAMIPTAVRTHPPVVEALSTIGLRDVASALKATKNAILR